MIWVKYNWRYNIFGKNLSKAKNAKLRQKHFVNDFQTHVEKKIFPRKKLKVQMLNYGLQATVPIFFPFLLAYNHARPAIILMGTL